MIALCRAQQWHAECPQQQHKPLTPQKCSYFWIFCGLSSWIPTTCLAFLEELIAISSCCCCHRLLLSLHWYMTEFLCLSGSVLMSLHGLPPAWPVQKFNATSLPSQNDSFFFWHHYIKVWSIVCNWGCAYTNMYQWSRRHSCWFTSVKIQLRKGKSHHTSGSWNII